MSNTPWLTTKRLILRRFKETDGPGLLTILGDKEVNRFLPMYPLTSFEEVEDYLNQKYIKSYEKPDGYHYAVCLKENDTMVGYIQVSDDESHDLGYGLRKDFWHMGLMTEAAKAVIRQLKQDHFPYITATHDRENPRSGEVMKKLGMTYQYSYEEQWQPKDILVTFRLYQLNLDGQKQRVYRAYWNRYPVHFVEEGM